MYLKVKQFNFILNVERLTAFGSCRMQLRFMFSFLFCFDFIIDVLLVTDY